MCGLYFSIGLMPNPANLEIVAHRGPDGRGWQEFASAAGPVALGHRRLSIFDVSEAGHQPMQDETGRFHLIFNGAIYNFEEIRQELAAEGIEFRSSSDSEVLLKALILHGKSVLPRLRGMFAFIFWDNRHKRAIVARDRFGIKPLYWRRTATGLAVGSEIKQLLALDGAVQPAANPARIDDYLAFGVSDHTSETLFDGVFQLQGGGLIEIDAAAAQLCVATGAWYQRSGASITLSAKEAAEQFKHLFHDAVRTHLLADVRLGSCLSGGLDSSAIVMAISQFLAQADPQSRIQTITAGYDIPEVDERAFAMIVAHAANAESIFVAPQAEDVFALASELTWHQDEPFGSTSIMAQWQVFRAAKQAGLTVMLDGQGADELLAGYHPAFAVHLSTLVRQGKMRLALASLQAWSHSRRVSIPALLMRAVASMLAPGPLSHVRFLNRCFRQHNWLRSGAIDPFGPMIDAIGLKAPLDLAGVCHSMTFRGNLPMLLHWEDRNSMAHGIEARVPFLDFPLAEFCLALGNDHKFAAPDTKAVLRRALEGLLPEAVRTRGDKLGFSTPEAIWFRGPLRAQAEAGVEKTLALFSGHFHADGARRFVQDMLDGRRPLDFSLWRIINLGIWGERFGVSSA